MVIGYFICGRVVLISCMCEERVKRLRRGGEARRICRKKVGRVGLFGSAV